MNEGTQKIERIKKTSKAVMNVSKISMVFCIVMDCLLLLIGVILIGFKNIWNELLIEGINSGAMDISDVPFSSFFGPAVFESGEFIEALFGYLMSMLGGLVFLTVILYFVSRIFKKFRESYSPPFNERIVKDLQITFILITLISLKSSLLVGLVFGLALWCVLEIFEYGCELQKQSDETL